MCGRTDIVKALNKHGADVQMKTQDKYIHVYKEVRIFVSFYLLHFFIPVSLLNYTCHIHVYAMFSFYRKSTLHYILLLNLV